MCCRCCQSCIETCYWHLIEKRFCYDENIALYEEPEKNEKNNNVFDNWAFYDSVAVIAGRSIVTIDPPPQIKPVLQQPITKQPVVQQHFTQKPSIQPPVDQQPPSQDPDAQPPQSQTQSEPVVQQPKKLQFSGLKTGYFSKSVPLIFERTIIEEDVSKSDVTINNNKETSEDEDTEKSERKSSNLLEPESNVEYRRRSLLERRMSKSLYLKIDQHKELPIIRQNSMPKFYLDTPQPHQTESSIYRSPSTALASPVKPNSSGFVFDLYSVVQMEKERAAASTESPTQRDERSKKLFQLRDKIKLRRVKSSLSTLSIPHAHHM